MNDVLGLDSLPPFPRVVTIGTFDGVHRGHAMLIQSTMARATALGVKSTIVTFEPVPAAVLRPAQFSGRICTAKRKIALLQSQNCDEIVVIEFDLELASQSPEDFLGMLHARTQMIELWVGEGFALGKNRVGGVPRITAIGAGLGFETIAMPRVVDGGETISSSNIRSAIQIGAVAAAASALGRPFTVAGEVIHGAHLGRKIGFPTANFVPPEGMVQLGDGIYASLVLLPEELNPRPAMSYMGTRPTVDGGARQVETHILDFDGDLYGQIIEVAVLEKIRDDQTFDGLDALVAQLRIDEQMTREMLAGMAPSGHFFH